MVRQAQKLLQALYTIRSERLLMEEIDYSILFRWFIGLSLDEEIWSPTVFSKNRDRLLRADVASAFFDAVLDQARGAALLSDEHFTVDGTMLEAWASLKSFQRKDGGSAPPPDDPGNPTVNFDPCPRESGQTITMGDALAELLADTFDDCPWRSRGLPDSFVSLRFAAVLDAIDADRFIRPSPRDEGPVGLLHHQRGQPLSSGLPDDEVTTFSVSHGQRCQGPPMPSPPPGWQPRCGPDSRDRPMSHATATPACARRPPRLRPASQLTEVPAHSSEGSEAGPAGASLASRRSSAST